MYCDRLVSSQRTSTMQIYVQLSRGLTGMPLKYLFGFAGLCLLHEVCLASVNTLHRLGIPHLRMMWIGFCQDSEKCRAWLCCRARCLCSTLFIIENAFFNFFSEFGIYNDYTIGDLIDFYMFAVKNKELFNDDYLVEINRRGRKNRLALLVDLVKEYFSDVALMQMPSAARRKYCTPKETMIR